MARRQTPIQLDERAAAAGRSRSGLVRKAIDLLLRKDDSEAIDAGYDRIPPGAQDPSAAAIHAIGAQPWRGAP